MKKFKFTVCLFLALCIFSFGSLSLCPLSAEDYYNISTETYGEYSYRVLSDGTIEITDYSGGPAADIPESIEGMPVSSIGSYAFCKPEGSFTEIIHYRNELAEVTIPSSVTNIGMGAFLSNELTSVVLPESIISIGPSAFASNKLTEITIPASVISIGDAAFANNRLDYVTFSGQVQHLGFNAFWNSDSGISHERFHWPTIDVYECKDSNFTGANAKISFSSDLHLAPKNKADIWPILVPSSSRTDDVFSTFNPAISWYDEKGSLADLNADVIPAGTYSVSIPPQKTDDQDPEDSILTLHFGEGRADNIYWSPRLSYTPCQFDRSLAMAGLWLSRIYYYNISDLHKNLEELGYQFFVDYDLTDTTDILIDMTIGSKVFSDGQKVIVVVIKGSDGLDWIWHDIPALLSPFLTGGGFISAGLQAYDNLKSYMKNLGYSANDGTKFFITGHSLGGAVAGQLAQHIYHNQAAPADNLFIYTFASPRYQPNPFSRIGLADAVFNIINDNDVVPDFPLQYCRLGRRLELKGSLFERVTGGWNLYSQHATETYFDLLFRLRKTPELVYEDILSNIFHCFFHCPVDIRIYDSTGFLIAESKGEQALNYSSGNFFLTTDGDQKNAYFTSPQDYHFVMEGTGSGRMAFGTAALDLNTGKFTEINSFHDIPLEKGTSLYGTCKADSAVSSLFLLNSDGKATDEFTENGSLIPVQEQELTRLTGLSVWIPERETAKVGIQTPGGTAEYSGPNVPIAASSLREGRLPRPGEAVPYAIWFISSLLGACLLLRRRLHR